MNFKTQWTICAIVGFLVTGCSQPSQDKPTDETAIKPLPQISHKPKPIPKENGKEIQQTIHLEPLENSYYWSLLKPEHQQSTQEIKEALRQQADEVLMTTAIAIPEFKKIMRIIWLDEPEFFYLNKKVAFEVDEQQLVRKIAFEYSTKDREWIKTVQDTAKKTVTALREGSDTGKNYSIVQALKEVFPQTATLCLENSDNPQINPSTISFIHEKRKPCFSPEGIKNWYVYHLRALGINAFSIYGQQTSSVYENSPIPLPERGKFVEEYQLTGQSGVYQVDSSQLLPWLLVQINQDYYHFDPFYNYYITNDVLNQEAVFEGLSFVNDSLMSVSKLYYMNDELLGIAPHADSHQFTHSFRKDGYIQEKSDIKMNAELDHLITKMSESTSREMVFQFELSQNYHYFLDNFEKQLEIKNRTLKRPIDSYQWVPLRDSQAVVFLKIKR